MISQDDIKFYSARYQVSSHVDKTFLEPILQKLASYRTSAYKDSEQKDQVQVMIELRQSIDALNANLNQFRPQGRRIWLWNKRGER